MTYELAAAYHEAAHIVIAAQSRFHLPYGSIDLGDYGSGACSISLSKSKLKKAGKPATPAAEKDPDVARDFALVLVAGYIGEQEAGEGNSIIKPNILCARPDHELAQEHLSDAGESTDLGSYETEVRTLLKKAWPQVEKLATFLFSKGRASLDEILEVIGS